ncbi:MAG: hypothetical protein WKG00_07630 [Polyangiaceae bacterium]
MRGSWGAFGLVAALAAAGCSSDGAEGGPSSAASSGEPCSDCDCPEGFEAGAHGCVAVAPLEACPAGTRPSLGDRDCVPTGWTSGCPEGFELDTSGWGCHAVLPAEACDTGLERIGSTACEPVACADAFPPPGATLFVDASLPPEDIDATHFASLTAALAAAEDGDVIAVEAGTYVEGVHVLASVEVVGRCASQVRVESPGGGLAGFDVENAGAVRLSGMTISGHLGGVLGLGSEVTVEDVALQGNRAGGVVALSGSMHLLRSRIVGTVPEGGTQGMGLLAQGGAQVDVDSSALVGNHVAGAVSVERGTRVTVSRSVVRDTVLAAGTERQLAGGLIALEDALVEVRESALLSNVRAHVSVDGATATLADSVLQAATPDATAFGGHGVEVQGGGSVEVTRSALVGNEEAQLLATGAGTTATLTGVVARGPFSAAEGATGIGVVADTGAVIDLDDVALVQCRDSALVSQEPGAHIGVRRSLVTDTVRIPGVPASGVGVRVGFGGSLEADDLAVVRSIHGGILVGGLDNGAGGSAVLRRTLVIDTTTDETGQFGRGVDVWNATAELEACAVLRNHQAGVIVGGDSSLLTARQSLVEGTLPYGDGTFGDGSWPWLVPPRCSARSGARTTRVPGCCSRAARPCSTLWSAPPTPSASRPRTGARWPRWRRCPARPRRSAWSSPRAAPSWTTARASGPARWRCPSSAPSFDARSALRELVPARLSSRQPPAAARRGACSRAPPRHAAACVLRPPSG